MKANRVLIVCCCVLAVGIKQSTFLAYPTGASVAAEWARSIVLPSSARWGSFALRTVNQKGAGHTDSSLAQAPDTLFEGENTVI